MKEGGGKNPNSSLLDFGARVQEQKWVRCALSPDSWLLWILTFSSSKPLAKPANDSCNALTSVSFGKDTESSVGKATWKPKIAVSQLVCFATLIYCSGGQWPKTGNRWDQVLGRVLRCAHELCSAPLLLASCCLLTHEWATKGSGKKIRVQFTENISSLSQEKQIQPHAFFSEGQHAILHSLLLEDGISS